MEHFRNVVDKEKVFYINPMNFNKYTDKELLANSLGATMYTPSTNTSIAKGIIEGKYPGLTTNVWCLEDAIADKDVEFGEQNIEVQLDEINNALENGILKYNDLPLLFIRVRTPEQLGKILKLGKKLKPIVGFNFPKFSSENGEAFFDLLRKANKELDECFYGMPILETPEIIYKELRVEELSKIKFIVDKYKDLVLNIRLGGTDFSSLYGIRRGVDFNIYNIMVISECMTDIMNVFGRASENYTISGVVWEYFPDQKRLLKPQLREAPFQKYGQDGIDKRANIITKEIDGLIKEVILDKANGFSGKTVIHPCHISIVNGLQCVSYEEYVDAMAILKSQGDGVFKGESGNKMNEVKPHYNWAKKIYQKSKIYGVMNKNADYTNLF